LNKSSTNNGEEYMSIDINTSGIHHVALRVTNLQISKQFYIDTLGFQVVLEKPEFFIFMAGTTAIGILGPDTTTKKDDRFSPFRVGLDHLSFVCESEEELSRVATALEDSGIENTGVKLDETLGKKYVAFKDPDRISLEFYMK
jgi:glyoxylase I family protein